MLRNGGVVRVRRRSSTRTRTQLRVEESWAHSLILWCCCGGIGAIMSCMCRGYVGVVFLIGGVILSARVGVASDGVATTLNLALLQASATSPSLFLLGVVSTSSLLVWLGASTTSALVVRNSFYGPDGVCSLVSSIYSGWQHGWTCLT
jgi:hypothetical protein